MSITSETIFSLRGPSGNALVNIIPDLWPCIIKYLDNHLFAIGEFYQQYDYYRLVRKEDIENNELMLLFAYLYRLNNGILGLGNTSDYGHNIQIYGEDYGNNTCLLSFNETYIRTSEKKNSNGLITLTTRGTDINVFHDNIEKVGIIYSWLHGTRGVGLFIRKDYTAKNESLELIKNEI